MNASLNSCLLTTSLINTIELIKASPDSFLNMKVGNVFRNVYNEVTNFSGTQYLQRVIELIQREEALSEKPHEGKLLYVCSKGNTHKLLDVYASGKDFIVKCLCDGNDDDEQRPITKEKCRECKYKNNAVVVAATVDQFRTANGRSPVVFIFFIQPCIVIIIIS